MHTKSANARVHIGEAPYHRMEMSNMETSKHYETSEAERLNIIYGLDTKGRIYTKNQLGGEVLAIHRWKSKQHYVDGKPAAKITEHSHDIGSIHVSSGNSHHSEPMPNIVWSSEAPINDTEWQIPTGDRPVAERLAAFGLGSNFFGDWGGLDVE